MAGWQKAEKTPEQKSRDGEEHGPFRPFYRMSVS
jgi:hypothetical protein